MDNDVSTMNIRQWAEGFRSLAKAGPEMAKSVAVEMKRDVDKAISEGRSVDGVTWQLKKDGGRPLVNAAKAVYAYGVGSVAFIILKGVEVFHHFGAGRNPRRAILPSGGTDKLGNAIRRGIITVCNKFLTRSGRHDKGSGGTKFFSEGAK